MRQIFLFGLMSLVVACGDNNDVGKSKSENINIAVTEEIIFMQNREKECLSYMHKDKYFKERLEMHNVLDKHEEAVQKFCKCYVERQWSEGVISEQELYPKNEGDFFMFYDYCLIQLGLME